MKKTLLILPILFLIGAFQIVSAQENPTSSLKGKTIVDIAGGTVTGAAIKLKKPKLPFCNCKFGKSSEVIVQFTVDESGNVALASAITGHPLLKLAGEKAIRSSKFSISHIDGIPVKAFGTITYIFLSSKWKARVVKYTLKLEK